MAKRDASPPAAPSPSELLEASAGALREALETNRALQARLRRTLVGLSTAAERNARLVEDLDAAAGSGRSAGPRGKKRGAMTGASALLDVSLGAPDAPSRGSVDVVDVDPMRAPALLAPQTRDWFWDGVLADHERAADDPTQAGGEEEGERDGGDASPDSGSGLGPGWGPAATRGGCGTLGGRNGSPRARDAPPAARPPPPPTPFSSAHAARVSFLRAVGDALPPWPPRTAWTPRERAALRSAVATVAQEEAVQRQLDEMERELDWDFDGDGDEEAHRPSADGPRPYLPPPAAFPTSFLARRQEIERLATDPRLVDQASESFSPAEWSRVARAAGLRRRGWAEVAAAWRAEIRPTLREGAWTAEEDDALSRAVARWGDRDWETVAEQGMGGKRSALQCLGRYGRMEEVWGRENAAIGTGAEQATNGEARGDAGADARSGGAATGGDAPQGPQSSPLPAAPVGKNTLEPGAAAVESSPEQGAALSKSASRPSATSRPQESRALRSSAGRGGNGAAAADRSAAGRAAMPGDVPGPAAPQPRPTATPEAPDPFSAAATPPPAADSRSAPGSAVDLARLLDAVSRHGRRWKLVAAEFDNRWRPQQLMHVWRRFVQREGIAGRGGSQSRAKRAAGGGADAEESEGTSRAPPRRSETTRGGDATAVDLDGPPDAASHRRPPPTLPVPLSDLAPLPRKGRWTPAEDDALTRAVALVGTKWSRVSPLVPGRTDVQCRERWVNALSAGIKRGEPWTEGEDERLARVVEGLRRPDGRVPWAAVAREMPGRTDSMVAMRWKKTRGGGKGPGGGG